MNKVMTLVAALLICTPAFLGCSGDNLVTPSGSSQVAVRQASNGAQTHLWGCYDVCIDAESGTAMAVLDRQAMFTCNVVSFLNGKATAMGFKINQIKTTDEWTDIDIDVTLTHPFPGMPQYNGYDVRGVFMGDGSVSLNYNPPLIYVMSGIDQMMLADPDDGFGGPDGYTRCFNQAEFSTGELPLFQYTQGKLAPPAYWFTATLNPYKYFADDLGGTEDLWTFLNGNSGQFGRFSSGVSNTRNYYLRFPKTDQLLFGYAVIANWKGDKPEDHPANAPEAMAVKVGDQSTLYYVSPTERGGDIVFDISVWDWDSVVNGGGVMEDYNLIIESTVLTAPSVFSGLTPIGGGEHFSTYHVDIPADNVVLVEGQEYWVIVEDQNNTYQNDFGVTNTCGDEKLAAFFRGNLYVSPIGPPPEGCHDPDWSSAAYNSAYASIPGIILAWNESYYFPPRASRVANPPRIFVPTGSGAQAVGVIDAETYTNIPYSQVFGNIIAHLEVTSADKIIYAYNGSNQLYARDWTNASGFSAETNFGPLVPQYTPPSGSPIDGSPWKMSITDDDRPMLLVRYPAYGTSAAVQYFIWNGIDWGTGHDLPPEVQDANKICTGGSLNASYMSDFDYDSATGNILIAMHDNGALGYLFAFDESGIVKWHDDNVFDVGSLNSKRIAIEIPKDPEEAKCRILVYVTHEFPTSSPTYFTVFDQDGNKGAMATLSAPGDAASNNGYEMGLVPPVGSNPWRLWGQGGTWYIGMYNWVNLPDDF